MNYNFFVEAIKKISSIQMEICKTIGKCIRCRTIFPQDQRKKEFFVSNKFGTKTSALCSNCRIIVAKQNDS